jgi:hypothetical protein
MQVQLHQGSHSGCGDSRVIAELHHSDTVLASCIRVGQPASTRVCDLGAASAIEAAVVHKISLTAIGGLAVAVAPPVSQKQWEQGWRQWSVVSG